MVLVEMAWKRLGELPMDEKKAIEGHRKAIREHIEKYKKYKLDHEKNFAWKTIQNAQKQISDIKKRKKFPDSSEDTWKPPA
jgi:hypothetical protein